MNLPLNDPTSNPALRPLPCSLLVFFFLLFLPPKRASSFDKAKIRRFSMNTRETFSFFDAKSHWADRSKAILKFVSWLLLYGAGGKTGVACLKLFDSNLAGYDDGVSRRESVSLETTSFFLPLGKKKKRQPSTIVRFSSFSAKTSDGRGGGGGGRWRMNSRRGIRFS